MKCVSLLAALGAASAAACGDPTATQLTQLNLDRPVDVSFACYGAMRQTNGRAPGDPADPMIQTAQPAAACAALSPSLSGTQQPAPGQETLNGGVAIVPSWYAFFLQSASGTVALATWTPKPADTIAAGVSDTGGDFQVLDGDPLTPGKNAISIGEDPVAIATDKAGCFEVTANAGSCDLSELDINSTLDDIPPVPGKAATPARVKRLAVTNANGAPILAKPAAMVAEPGATTVGLACPMTATGRVYIAYPSCHLVAGVDTATGQVVTGISFDATGTPSILSGAALAGVSCPDECTNATGGVGNGQPTPGVRPVALDLRLDTRVDGSKAAVTSRLAIGTQNSMAPADHQSAPIIVVDLDPTTSDPKSPLLSIALEDRAAQSGKPAPLGVTGLALSPQIGMGGNVADGPVSDDASPAGQGQYVYAVATDGTVRVADVLTLKQECDTQVDGRFVRSVSDPVLMQCFPLSGPKSLPRRSGAKGPGIELPGDAVPTSVTIVKARNTPLYSDTEMKVPLPPAPTTLVGYFAMVMGSNGQGYVVNLDDDYAPDIFAASTSPLSTAPALVMAHQLRDAFSSRGQGPEVTDGSALCAATDPQASHGGAVGGGPRLLSTPAASAPTGTITLGSVLPLPTLQEVACTLDQNGGTPVSELDFGAPLGTRDQVYPDLQSVRSETWSLTWEGTLSLDFGSTVVDGPSIRSGQIVVDGLGMRLQDPAQPFCDMGVELYDVVDLRGCSPANGDGDCPAGYTCYVHPRSVGVGVGACMLKSEAPRLADACFPFLTTLRRYTVGRTNTGDVTLLERKHELANTPIDGCVDDNQCDLLAQDALKIDASLAATDPFTSRTHWTCQSDPLRAPINADAAKNKRCVQACSTDPVHPLDCATGTICRLPDTGGTEGVCMEGVEPPQACVRGPQRYDVRASEAFTVIGTSSGIGSSSGYVHPIIKDPNSVACIRDPKLDAPNSTVHSSVQIGRIPLNPLSVPACVAGANPITGQLPAPAVGFEPNPCSTTVNQFDTIQPVAMPACAAAPQALAAPAVRSTPAIKFRNRAMTLTLVDPYQSCLPGGQGTPANIPFANRGYQVEFVQKAGFSPLQIQNIVATYPVKVVRGPSDSFWIMDDGDFLSTSITVPSTRGRVFRVEGIDISVVNVFQ